MKNQKGFSLVESLLLLVLVGLIGFVGWYVWNTHNKTADTLNNADQANSSVANYSKKQAATTSSNDAYAGWKEYCSKQEKSCFKYPSDWIAKSEDSPDSSGDSLRLTSSKGTVIIWNSSVSGIGGDC